MKINIDQYLHTKEKKIKLYKRTWATLNIENLK